MGKGLGRIGVKLTYTKDMGKIFSALTALVRVRYNGIYRRKCSVARHYLLTQMQH